jgi:hypothetical protein
MDTKSGQQDHSDPNATHSEAVHNDDISAPTLPAEIGKNLSTTAAKTPQADPKHRADDPDLSAKRTVAKALCSSTGHFENRETPAPIPAFDAVDAAPAHPPIDPAPGGRPDVAATATKPAKPAIQVARAAARRTKEVVSDSEGGGQSSEAEPDGDDDYGPNHPALSPRAARPPACVPPPVPVAAPALPPHCLGRRRPGSKGFVGPALAVSLSAQSIRAPSSLLPRLPPPPPPPRRGQGGTDCLPCFQSPAAQPPPLAGDGPLPSDSTEPTATALNLGVLKSRASGEK